MISLKDIAKVFLKLGIIGFGGPAAHIAMMEEETVKKRKWLTHEEFLDLLGATNLIPGPNSTEMAIHIGWRKAGGRGLLTAGLCFILPAVVITLFFAWLYVRFGTLPGFDRLTWGIRPAVLAVILAAVFRLGKSVVKNHFIVVLALVIAVLNLMLGCEIILLLAAGIMGILWHHRVHFFRRNLTLIVFSLFSPVSTSGSEASSSLMTPSLGGLGLFFMKVGAILYGSGYVLIAFLQAGLVNSMHWITQTQLLDGIAVGQFTPGPLLSTAAFIGYLILGVKGGVIAAAAIFLPSFIFVLMASPFIPRLRNSPAARGFLDGVNAASLGLMASAGLHLASSTVTTWPSCLIFLSAVCASFFWNLSAAWLVLGGALLGWFFHCLSLV